MKKTIKNRIAAGCLMAAMALQSLAIPSVHATETDPGVTLEKTAHWVDEDSYQAEIDLTVKGIQKYTETQSPVSLVPVLDVTASMNFCDTPGHTKGVLRHTVAAMENSRQVWEEISQTLPDEETYRQMGQESPEQLFLPLPESIDPQGKCRLVCRQEAASDGLPYDNMGGWKIVYVTDDQTLLSGVRPGAKTDRFTHTIEQNGIYLPVGETQVLENRTTWVYQSGKSQRWSCEKSRLERLGEGYTQILDAVFQDMEPQICPVAFTGGYYINGWTQSKDEAVNFLVNREYLNKEAVLPAEVNGTNHEAAVLGALQAVEQLENTENSFVILFTDGTTTAGYTHGSGQADTGVLDSHSYGMSQETSSWYGQFAQWALEDAQLLKEKIPVYGVGYGSDIQADSDCQEFIEKLSSGQEYYIDTRREDMQDIGSIFKAIYSDLSWKAVKVKVTDYVSEYWEVREDQLPMGCKVEKVGIVNQRGEEDTVTRIIFPVTREMGQDDEETFRIPVVLREAYRDVQVPTFYETNQDEPLSKDVPGAGAFVTYEDENQELQKVEARTPELEVYPQGVDYSIEKSVDKEQVKAGEQVAYQVTLTNTGGKDLENISLTDTYLEREIPVQFQGQEGVKVSQDGTQAVVVKLSRGETVTVDIQARIPENEEGTLVNRATASVANPENTEEILTREAEASVNVEPAVLDYKVEKTADRNQAKGGDTIHYEIAITNTGQRTLHSVVATDKFTVEGVQAVFQEQEGVILNREKNQAFIEAIQPGEKVVLKASVTLPKDFKDEKLVNMAVVSVDGGDPRESQAEVEIAQTESATQAARASSRTGTGTATSKASPVKTQDESRWDLYGFAALASLATIGVGAIHRTKNRKVEK
ncbi:MAG: hypothetical protein ACLR9K_04210 [Blautia sp.]